MPANGPYLIALTVGSIALLLFLILAVRLHAFLALLLAAMFLGLAVGCVSIPPGASTDRNLGWQTPLGKGTATASQNSSVRYARSPSLRWSIVASGGKPGKLFGAKPPGQGGSRRG